jgi:hypothetical protein
MELSRDNLRLAKRVVGLMNERGARQMREAGTAGPQMAALVRDCIREVS